MWSCFVGGSMCLLRLARVHCRIDKVVDLYCCDWAGRGVQGRCRCQGSGCRLRRWNLRPGWVCIWVWLLTKVFRGCLEKFRVPPGGRCCSERKWPERPARAAGNREFGPASFCIGVLCRLCVWGVCCAAMLESIGRLRQGRLVLDLGLSIWVWWCLGWRGLRMVPALCQLKLPFPTFCCPRYSLVLPIWGLGQCILLWHQVVECSRFPALLFVLIVACVELFGAIYRGRFWCVFVPVSALDGRRGGGRTGRKRDGGGGWSWMLRVSVEGVKASKRQSVHQLKKQTRYFVVEVDHNWSYKEKPMGGPGFFWAEKQEKWRKKINRWGELVELSGTSEDYESCGAVRWENPGKPDYGIEMSEPTRHLQTDSSNRGRTWVYESPSDRVPTPPCWGLKPPVLHLPLVFENTSAPEGSGVCPVRPIPLVQKQVWEESSLGCGEKCEVGVGSWVRWSVKKIKQCIRWAVWSLEGVHVDLKLPRATDMDHPSGSNRFPGSTTWRFDACSVNIWSWILILTVCQHVGTCQPVALGVIPFLPSSVGCQ